MFENFSQPVDIYCERLDPSFWAEPINALTNFAFILAAVFTYGLWREYTPKARDIKLLVVLAAIVGIGSFIFHTVATKGASLADIIPIVIFINCGLAVIFHRVFNQSWLKSIALTIGFLIVNGAVMSSLDRSLFNGSLQYVPTLIALFIISFLAASKKHIATKELFLASIVFLVSITCRSMDKSICESFPLGIHFMWHVLNAAVMYYVIKGLIKAASGHKHLLRRK